MRRQIAGLLAACQMLTPALAQQSPVQPSSEGRTSLTAPVPLLVRVLDEDALFGSSLFGQRVLREIDTASRALEQENAELLEQLTRQEADLTAARPTMTPVEFRAAADAFDVQAESIRRNQAEKRARLSSYQDFEQRRFFQLAAPILQQVLLQSGAQVVIDARALILGVDGMDLTRDAITAVDAAIGDGGPSPMPLSVP